MTRQAGSNIRSINELRLFAQPATIGAAEAVLDGIVETYAAAPTALKPHSSTTPRVTSCNLLRRLAGRSCRICGDC